MLRLKLKELLERNDISAYRLAQIIEDLDEQTIYHYVRGTRTPSLRGLESVIQGLRHLTGKAIELSDILEYVDSSDLKAVPAEEKKAWVFVKAEEVSPTLTLIGPEGIIHEATPVLRVVERADVQQYAFFVRNSRSHDFIIENEVTQSPRYMTSKGQLLPGECYLWSARAYSEAGWGTFSSPLSFTVAASTTITTEPSGSLPSPVAKPVFETTSSLTPSLSVEPFADATGYGFYVRDLTKDALVYDNDYAEEATVTLPAGLLRPGGYYRWNARVKNEGGWSVFSEKYYFIVSSDASITVPTIASTIENIEGQLTAQATAQTLTLTGRDFVPGSRVLLTSPKGQITSVPPGFIVYRGESRLELSAVLLEAGQWLMKIITPDGQESNGATVSVRTSSFL